jgi:hypothetical protein
MAKRRVSNWLGKLICVRWLDAASSAGWEEVGVKASVRPKLCRSVGWCIVDNREFITVCPTLGEEAFDKEIREEPMGADAMMIPRGMVKKIEVLK